jgi:hypothetical protein
MDLLAQFAQNTIHRPVYDDTQKCIFCQIAREDHWWKMKNLRETLDRGCGHNGSTYLAHGKTYCRGCDEPLN